LTEKVLVNDGSLYAPLPGQWPGYVVTVQDHPADVVAGVCAGDAVGAPAGVPPVFVGTVLDGPAFAGTVLDGTALAGTALGVLFGVDRAVAAGARVAAAAMLAVAAATSTGCEL